MSSRFVFLAVFALMTAQSVHAQDENRPRFGLKVGQYRYASSQTRNTFDGNSLSISPDYSRAVTPDKRGRLRFDFGFNSSSDGDNRLIFVPVGVGYRATTGEGSTLPFYGGSLNVAPTYLKVPDQNKDGKLSFAVGGSAFAGVQFNQKFTIEARYFLFSKVRGYNLSGLELSAGVRF